jgi:hypothetical protein
MDDKKTETINVSLSIDELDLIRRMSFNNETLLSEQISNPKSIYYSFSNNDEVKRNLYFDSTTIRLKLIDIAHGNDMDFDNSKYSKNNPS